jgi:DNA-binding transcriptional ArsR family regulator
LVTFKPYGQTWQHVICTVNYRRHGCQITLLTANLRHTGRLATPSPRRRAIVQLVARSEFSAGEIASCFDVTRTAVSQHLTVLKNAGLLSERKLATRRLYRARPEGLAGLREFLDQMWASSLAVARGLVEADLGVGGTDHGAATG